MKHKGQFQQIAEIRLIHEPLVLSGTVTKIIKIFLEHVNAGIVGT
jgi:hypothetical protein